MRPASVASVRHPDFVIAVRWIVALLLGSFVGLTAGVAAGWLCTFYGEQAVAAPIGWVVFAIGTVSAAWDIFDRTIPRFTTSGLVGLLVNCLTLIGLVVGIGLQARYWLHDLAVVGFMLAGAAVGSILGGLYRLALHSGTTESRSAPSAV